LPLEVAYVRDKVLRLSNGSIEDEHIERLIRAAVDVYEDETQKAAMPQTWELVLSGFPCSGLIELPRPPFISISSVSFYDADDVLDNWDGSPSEYVVTPSGRYTPAILRPVVDGEFPTTAVRGDAITITYRCGHQVDESVDPPTGAMLESELIGIELLVGELYKQRTLSQVGTSIVEAPLQTSRFWKKVY
jgi:uncharacterized phiE125 gp8 family phage protein